MTVDYSYWWIHILLYPVYQIMGTVRHELSHAFSAVWHGADIEEIKVLPHRRDGVLYFGYISWVGDLTDDQRIKVYMAPYFSSVLFMLLWVSMLTIEWTLEGFHSFAVMTIICLISPVVDILYNSARCVFFDRGDIAEARKVAREKAS
jgi:hypothetical protein